MGHSLRPDNLTITPDFVISDGTHNTGYVLVSATGGVASWENITNLPGLNTNHYVGELWGGGVVAAVWKENDVEKCLIVALCDYSYTLLTPLLATYPITQFIWSNISSTSSATSSYDGLANSQYITAQSPSNTTNGAYVCLNYTNPDYGTGTFSNWYLPSVTEMQEVSNNSFKINYSINRYATDNVKLEYPWNNSNSYVSYITKYRPRSGEAIPFFGSTNNYLTSTEVMNTSGSQAYYIDMSNNTIVRRNKSITGSVRPVRIASETKIITAVEFVRSSSNPTYNVLLTSNISGSGDVFTEIGVVRNGPYSPVIYGASSQFSNNRGDGSGYGAATDKPAIPLPTISDTKTIVTMIYDPAIGFGYGDFNSSFSSLLVNSMYSVRAYAITNKGEVKYGEQLVLL